MSVQSVIKMGAADAALGPAPIRSSWVLEGNPLARNKLLSVSADGTASSYIWDCSAGRFKWIYEADETIYVIEGGVTIKDEGGSPRRLSAGDSIFFPAGACAEWHVDSYIRKFALVRTPLPRSVILAKKGLGIIRRMLRGNATSNATPAMFPNS